MLPVVLTKLRFCQQIPYIGLKICILSLILCKDFVEGLLLFSKLQPTHFAQKKLTTETTNFFKSDLNLLKFFFYLKQGQNL